MNGKRFQFVVGIGLVLGLVVGLGGCASSGDSKSGDAKSTAAATASDMPIPKSSKLSKVEIGMTDTQVRKAIGDPDNSRNYMTGKAWIPFYFGGDAYRSEWIYSGVGRVVYTRNRWSGSLKVMQLIHNPNEE